MTYKDCGLLLSITSKAAQPKAAPVQHVPAQERASFRFERLREGHHLQGLWLRHEGAPRHGGEYGIFIDYISLIDGVKRSGIIRRGFIIRGAWPRLSYVQWLAKLKMLNTIVKSAVSPRGIGRSEEIHAALESAILVSISEEHPDGCPSAAAAAAAQPPPPMPNDLRDDDIVQFGKHKGKKSRNAYQDERYCQWLLSTTTKAVDELVGCSKAVDEFLT